MLKTIQPVSNLRTYYKDITPVLEANRSVTLIQGGKIYGVICPPKEVKEISEENAFFAHLFIKYVHKINKQKSYSISQVREALRNHEAKDKKNK